LVGGGGGGPLVFFPTLLFPCCLMGGFGYVPLPTKGRQFPVHRVYWGNSGLRPMLGKWDDSTVLGYGRVQCIPSLWVGWLALREIVTEGRSGSIASTRNRKPLLVLCCGPWISLCLRNGPISQAGVPAFPHKDVMTVEPSLSFPLLE
jgi:hypothetical protein